MTLIEYSPEDDVTYCGYFNQHGSWIREKGYTLVTHAKDSCTGEWCCIHNPSPHPLWLAPLSWRGDRSLMERICDHGIGHPDPDDLDYKRENMDPKIYEQYAFGIHGCDGCCAGRRY